MSEDVYMVVVPGTEGDSASWPATRPYMTTVIERASIAVYRSQGAQTGAHPRRTGGFAEVSKRG